MKLICKLSDDDSFILEESKIINLNASKDFMYTFHSCHSVKGESPYTIIDGVKYHLYERHLNPDQFVTPTSYTDCFSESFSDSDEIHKHGWR